MEAIRPPPFVPSRPPVHRGGGMVGQVSCNASILERPVQYVRGVGPQRAAMLETLGIRTLEDLITWFPFRHEHQGPRESIGNLALNQPATIVAIVDSVGRRGAFRQTRINASVHDSTGRLRIIWFNATYLAGRLARGQVLRLFGLVEAHENLVRMVNPEIEWVEDDADLSEFDRPRLIPVYPASARLQSRQIARLVDTALPEALPAVTEPLPGTLLARRDLLERRQAITAMHHPGTLDEFQRARRRLAYEEFLLLQLAVMLQRRHVLEHARAQRLHWTAAIDERIRRRFPFPLTASQDRVIREMCGDLGGTRPMTRLLQGDVGSGKTVVALYAALVCVANRAQCAILAPTEVLAAQHFTSIEKYLGGSRVQRCLLTGHTPPARRQADLREIAAGRMNLIVGTQALLETKVRFSRLGLVIVDEQHKFGVAQRATLRDKRPRQAGVELVPHYLVMTATPIPRTLSMTVFGDLDVSVLDELPPGRQPVATRVVGPDEPAAWIDVRRRIAAGEQAYIVYPLVEESDALDLRAATAELERVRTQLLPGARVGLLHGRMRAADKAAAMKQFGAGELDALVCTTVIEVGVDVPNATVMVVQHAERFGLAALHQLRGRVGRGTRAALCLLLSDSRSEIARHRLGILSDTTDGFRIAEEDLRLRGPGELLGTRQHGWPELRVAHPVDDLDLLTAARDDAAELLRSDAALKDPAHAAVRAELARRYREKVAWLHIG